MKEYLFKFLIWFKRQWEKIENGKKKKQILEVKPDSSEINLPSAEIFTSFFVNNDERLKILKETLKVSLGSLSSGTKFIVSDASPEEYSLKIQQFLKGFDLEVDYRRESLKLPESYSGMFESSQAGTAITVFDDFPIFGLKPEFIKAASKFYRDFDGLVDMMLIELMLDFRIENESRKILCDRNNLEIAKKKSEVIRVVEYDGYKFAVIWNFHYTFFFFTFLVKRSVYLQYLKEFVSKFGVTHPSKIEKQGQLRKGPGFKIIAVPLDVFVFDFDYSHTGASVRDGVEKARELCEASASGYEVVLGGGIEF